MMCYEYNIYSNLNHYFCAVLCEDTFVILAM